MPLRLGLPPSLSSAVIISPTCFPGNRAVNSVVIVYLLFVTIGILFYMLFICPVCVACEAHINLLTYSLIKYFN